MVSVRVPFHRHPPVGQLDVFLGGIEVNAENVVGIHGVLDQLDTGEGDSSHGLKV